MFIESADIYDLVYSFKDYKKESEEITHIIKAKRPNCKAILDIASGTAEHHKYLKNNFELDGIDLNEKFIDIERQKNPNGSYTVADMSKFNLDKKYDVITCLFSSIGYLRSVASTVSALKCFNQHLYSDGFVILEPWFTAENSEAARIDMTSYDKADIKICRVSHSYPENEFSILHFSYLLGTLGQCLRQFEERHEVRRTSTEEMYNPFNEAGFDVTFDEKGLTGRGMYYGVKKNAWVN
ncbi:MAG: class I SAM-dependent methyltransferase [Ginsengibacter sp.]